MTPDPAAFQAFASVVAVVIFLGAGYGAFRKLGILAPRHPPPAPEQPSPDANAERIGALEREQSAFRLFIAENYVRRDDYVTNQSRVIGLLETHSVMLARLEERIGAMK